MTFLLHDLSGLATVAYSSVHRMKWRGVLLLLQDVTKVTGLLPVTLQHLVTFPLLFINTHFLSRAEQQSCASSGYRPVRALSQSLPCRPVVFYPSLILFKHWGVGRMKALICLASPNFKKEFLWSRDILISFLLKISPNYSQFGGCLIRKSSCSRIPFRPGGNFKISFPHNAFEISV